MTNKKSAKVLVGLSGGVDSAVSAFLLKKAGFHVEGVFLKNWSSTEGLVKAECPWINDRRDALRVSAFLGLPLHTLDFEDEYQKKVMNEFFAEYKAGNTPNPDVLCNEFIKFGLMYDWAIKQGFDYVATGHYATINQKSKIKNQNFNLKLETDKTEKKDTQSFYLAQSADSFKDQTYFLYRIKKGHLEHIIFPLGHLKKSEVKKIAKKVGLPVAERKESMGLCFVGKVRLQDFLKQKIQSKPGKIVCLDSLLAGRDVPQGQRGRKMAGKDEGKIIGQHQGLHNYTIGQRHGIEVASNKPYFVVAKDTINNILYVTQDPEDPRLFSKQVVLRKCNWLVEIQKSKIKMQNFNSKLETKTVNDQSYNLHARFRHQGELVPASIVSLNAHMATIELRDKQKALAKGQSLVLYDGDICLGGGIIC